MGFVVSGGRIGIGGSRAGAGTVIGMGDDRQLLWLYLGDVHKSLSEILYFAFLFCLRPVEVDSD